MVHPRRSSEAAQRAAARRQREDEAPRLLAEIPLLESLNIDVEEHLASGTVASTHVRRVVVDRAPALFDMPCNDRSCKEGGHDLTRPILLELRRGSTRFEGSHACEGQIGSSRCQMILHYVGHATYRQPAS
jgi:hypothetical protein